MKPKKSTFIGTFLLASLLALPGCDLAQPMNKQPEIETVTVQEPVEETAPTPPVKNTVAEVAKKPETAVAEINPPTALPKISTQPRTIPPRIQRAERPSAPQRFRQPAQLPPGWMPEKFATVEQFNNKELSEYLKKVNLPGHCPIKSEPIDIDPRGVGRNVIFSNEWLNDVGENKPLTQQQFEQWRNRADTVYDTYLEFLGKAPINGEKIFVNLQPKESFARSSHQGHAHTSTTNIICINSDSKLFGLVLQEIASCDSSEHTLMHEIAHLFANRMPWEIDRESIVDLLISYALEINPELHYGGIIRNSSIGWQKTAGAQHRLRRYQRALTQFRANRIDTDDEVFNMYFLGLPNVVGWDVIKETIQSYNDKDFVNPTKYPENTRIAKARDFFDRIKHFSGDPKVLQKLPDKGKLLEQHLAVIEERLNSKQKTEPVRQTQFVQPTLEK